MNFFEKKQKGSFWSEKIGFQKKPWQVKESRVRKVREDNRCFEGKQEGTKKLVIVDNRGRSFRTMMKDAIVFAITTLTLGSRPRQRDGKVQAKNATRESHSHS